MGGKLVVIQPNGISHIITILDKSWKLEKVQELVGGYIEQVKVRYEGKVRDAYVNEDGISQGLQFNQEATDLYLGYLKGSELRYLPQIVGTMVIWIPNPKKRKENVQANAGTA